MSKTDIVKCIAFCLIIVISFLILKPDFSPPPEPGADTALVEAPVLIMTKLELQQTLNRLDPDLKLEEDGIYGPATDSAWDTAVNNQYALELWPEDAK